MAQVMTSSTVHDVVIIGSGAGGGTVTKVLADLGISVLLMEAGPDAEHGRPQGAHVAVSSCRIAAPASRPGLHRRPGRSFTYSATFGGAQLEGEPYTVAPGSDFRWFRSRMLGGRTNHYGRVTLRYCRLRLQAALARRPRLGLADQLRGHVAVLRQGGAVHRRHRQAPKASAARRTASSSRRRAQARTMCSCSARAPSSGIRAVAARQAVITTPTNGRPACHYCGQCGRGCMTASNYAASYVQIFPAMKTGRVQVIANAMARELVTDASGKVTAVSYIDKTTGDRAAGPLPDGGARRERVRVGAAAAQLEVVSASAGPRELLRQGRPVPDGHRRLEHVGARFRRCPACRATTRTATGRTSTSRGGCGIKHKELNFPRGYHIEVGGGVRHARHRLVHRASSTGPKATAWR